MVPRSVNCRDRGRNLRGGPTWWMIRMARGGPRRCQARCGRLVTRQVDGRYVTLCDECLTMTVAEWSHHVSAPGAATRMRSKYGLTIGKHAQMFSDQGGLCAICRDPARSSKTSEHGSGLVIDHDHETGEVRGLLCARCNAAIGLLDDNAGWMHGAATYVSTRASKVQRKSKKERNRERTREHIQQRLAASE